MRLLRVLTCVILCVHVGWGFPGGAPATTCISMVPAHKNTSPQSSDPPYAIKAAQDPNAEGVYKVIVRGKGDQKFLGLLVKAKAETETNASLGAFVTTPAGTKMIDCGKDANAAVTHSDNSEKDSVELIWQPHGNFAGDITFVATILANYSTYWTKVASPKITIVKRDVEYTPNIYESIYDGCGVTKKCVGSSPKCIEAKDCTALVSINSNDDNGLESAKTIEMMALRSRYVAVGFSEDASMGGDGVLECVFDENEPDAQIKAYKSWNIRGNKGNLRMDEQTGYILKEGNYENGNIHCKVYLETEFEIEDTEFDLNKKEYHVLLAAGTMLKEKSVGYHHLRVVDPSKQLVSILSAAISQDPVYDGCNVLKNCFGYPEGCVDTQNCAAVVTIAAKGFKYEFELKAKDVQYVAVGLSDDAKMGGDSVAECVRLSNGDKIQAYLSWNIPNMYTNTRKGVKQDGITLVNATYDGSIYCKFLREAEVTVMGKSFDLTKEKYYVLLTAGSALKAESVGYHDIVQTISGSKFSLASVGMIGTASKLLLRLHGAFMIAAWIGSASIGIVLARYFKQTWVGSSLCGKDLWFAWHRFFMIITWSLTIAGFVIIFVEIGGWVSADSQIHAILGLLTTILCFTQPIGAAFRPHPTARNRPVFNWLHWFVGNAAHILAVVTIFFAIPLRKAELPEWLNWVMVAFVALYCGVHIIMSIASCFSLNKSSQRINSFAMKDINSSRSGLSAIERKQDSPHAGFRKFMLFIHLVGITALTISIIVIVVLAPIKTQWNSLQSKLMSM